MYKLVNPIIEALSNYKVSKVTTSFPQPDICSVSIYSDYTERPYTTNIFNYSSSKNTYYSSEIISGFKDLVNKKRVPRK